jgi:hypothetical protein
VSLPLQTPAAICAALNEGTLLAVDCATCRARLAFRGEPCEPFKRPRRKERPGKLPLFLSRRCEWCGVVVGGRG